MRLWMSHSKTSIVLTNQVLDRKVIIPNPILLSLSTYTMFPQNASVWLPSVHINYITDSRRSLYFRISFVWRNPEFTLSHSKSIFFQKLLHKLKCKCSTCLFYLLTHLELLTNIENIFKTIKFWYSVYARKTECICETK